MKHVPMFSPQAALGYTKKISSCILRGYFNCIPCILQSIKDFQSEEYLQILESEAALRIKENDKSLYVFDQFSGAVFNHLQKVCALFFALAVLMTESS